MTVKSSHKRVDHPVNSPDSLSTNSVDNHDNQYRALSGGSPVARHGNFSNKRSKIYFPLFLLFILLASSGCLELVQEIKINEDGSAEFLLRYSVPLEMIEVMGQSQEVLREWRKGEPPASQAGREWFFNEELAKEYFNESGLELISYQDSVDIEKERRVVEIKVVATDFERAIASGKFGDFNFSETEDGNRRLQAEISFPAGLESDGDSISESEKRVYGKLLKGMRIEFKIHTPDPIIETDGEKTGSNSARWIIEPENDPEFLRNLPLFEIVY